MKYDEDANYKLFWAIIDDSITTKGKYMKFLTVLFVLYTTLFTLSAFADKSTSTSLAYSQGVGVLQLNDTNGTGKRADYAAVIAVTVDAPAAGAFTCAVTDICTKASHGYQTGLKVQLTTTTTLPAGLALATDYFVIRLSASTFSLASSSALAQAGTAIDITDTGTGTHTITPTALAGASLKLQGSMDGTTYVDLPIKATGDATKSANITTTANFYLSEIDAAVNFIRVYYTLTAGQLSIVQIGKTSR